jgi:hypothetical protein
MAMAPLQTSEYQDNREAAESSLDEKSKRELAQLPRGHPLYIVLQIIGGIAPAATLSP